MLYIHYMYVYINFIREEGKLEILVLFSSCTFLPGSGNQASEQDGLLRIHVQWYYFLLYSRIYCDSVRPIAHNSVVASVYVHNILMRCLIARIGVLQSMMVLLEFISWTHFIVLSLSLLNQSTMGGGWTSLACLSRHTDHTCRWLVWILSPSPSTSNTPIGLAISMLCGAKVDYELFSRYFLWTISYGGLNLVILAGNVGIASPDWSQHWHGHPTFNLQMRYMCM